ncbi:MAG: hypothetical protein ABL886_06265 [Rhodoglobus sp.]
MTWQLLSVLPVWVASLIAAVIIAVTSAPGQQVTWLAIALAAAVIVTFFIQLGIQRKEGFVLRAIASIGGAVVVLAAASGIFALVG